MNFNFDLKNTEVTKLVKTERFLFFRFAKIFKNTFLFLFLLALLLTGFSFLNFVSGYTAVRMLSVFLSLYIIFWNLDLFTDLKIKKPKPAASIVDAASNPEGYNLAGFLSFNSVKIVQDSIRLSKKRKIQVNSAGLFYSAVRFSKDISLVCVRLGINPKKLQSDLKNYLEKMQKQDAEGLYFADDFQKTIESALKFSVERNNDNIGEKEILAALARHDEFFKKLLVEFDLKPEDVENLTLWLDSAEDFMERGSQFWSSENLSRQGSFKA